jgi:hypothetical protein
LDRIRGGGATELDRIRGGGATELDRINALGLIVLLSNSLIVRKIQTFVLTKDYQFYTNHESGFIRAKV